MLTTLFVGITCVSATSDGPGTPDLPPTLELAYKDPSTWFDETGSRAAAAKAREQLAKSEHFGSHSGVFRRWPHAKPPKGFKAEDPEPDALWFLEDSPGEISPELKPVGTEADEDEPPVKPYAQWEMVMTAPQYKLTTRDPNALDCSPSWPDGPPKESSHPKDSVKKGTIVELREVGDPHDHQAPDYPNGAWFQLRNGNYLEGYRAGYPMLKRWQGSESTLFRNVSSSFRKTGTTVNRVRSLSTDLDVGTSRFISVFSQSSLNRMMRLCSRIRKITQSLLLPHPTGPRNPTPSCGQPGSTESPGSGNSVQLFSPSL